MADLQELISSISDEDMKKLQSVAASIMGGAEEKPQTAPARSPVLPFDDNTIGKVMSLMGQMGKEDDRTRLINDLKPLLSPERRKRADEAVKFLQLMEMLPLLKGLFGNE